MLTEEQLIKFVMGVAVFVIVVGGVYLFFKYNILDFFKNLGGEKAPEIVLSLIK